MGFVPKSINPTNCCLQHITNAHLFSCISREGGCALPAAGRIYGEFDNITVHVTLSSRRYFCNNDIILNRCLLTLFLILTLLHHLTSDLCHHGHCHLQGQGLEGCQQLLLILLFQATDCSSLIQIGVAFSFVKTASSSTVHSL